MPLGHALLRDQCSKRLACEPGRQQRISRCMGVLATAMFTGRSI